MPHDPVVVRTDVKSERGMPELVVETSYEAPANADSTVAEDKYKAMDLANAKWMHETLTGAYPGYGWRTIYDGAQKMAYFSIPILMGINKFWAINLVTDELTKGLLIRGGGTLLERYGLRRGKLHLDQFLEAREKHSALVVPSRSVPE